MLKKIFNRVFYGRLVVLMLLACLGITESVQGAPAAFKVSDIITKGPTIDVRAFGAKPSDGEDDTAAIQAALSHADSIGGAIVRNDVAGDYLLTSTLKVGTNTSLVSAPGVRYRKGHDATFLTNGLGYDSTSEILPYEGHGNIVIDGGIWDGFSEGIFDSYTGFAFGHGKNITVRNVTLKDSIGGGHGMDISGCDGVLIENSRFVGQALGTGNTDTQDMIQLDHNVEGSFPYFSVPNFAPNRNVTVRGCYFGPNPNQTDERFGSVYSGVGAHGAVHDLYQENIIIENNVFDSCLYAGVRSWKWRKVRVTGNRFSGERGVHVTQTSPGLVSSQDVSRIQTNLPQAGNDYYISGNTFENLNDIGVFFGEFTPTTESGDNYAKHENVTITGNVFKDVGRAIEARWTRGTTIIGNKFKDVYRAVGGRFNDSFSIIGNTADGVEREFLYLSEGTETQFARQGFSSNLHVAQNNAENIGYSGINISSADGFSVVGNVLRNVSTAGALYGIDVSTEAKNGYIGGNTVIDDGDSQAEYGLRVSSTTTNIAVGPNALEGLIGPLLNNSGTHQRSVQGLTTISGVGSLAGPAIFLENFNEDEGEIAVPVGQALDIGHYDSASGVFTSRMKMDSEGQFVFANLIDAADDAAAQSAGVSLGALYRTGSVLKVRID